MSDKPVALTHKELFEHMVEAFGQTLEYGTKDAITLLKDPAYLPVLDYTATYDKQTPLYCACYHLITSNYATPRRAELIARNLSDILEEIEGRYGRKVLADMTNTICYSHPLEHKRRHMECLRDLLEHDEHLAPAFTPLIRRFQLLSREEVIEERLPFRERVSIKELDKIRFR